MSTQFNVAAQAIADHFKQAEAKRGEPFPDTFINPMNNDAVTPNSVGIPVAMLRALRPLSRPITPEQAMTTYTETIKIAVRATGGTYQTNSVRGFKASCTAGERQAAERLGEKLYGASLVTVEALPRGSDHNLTHWRLHAEPVHAWAWQSGLIEFGREVPEGALRIAGGFDVKLREVVGVLARHGQDESEGKLFVPGVPEAETEIEKVDALIAWVDWCAKRNGTEANDGVVFTNRQNGRPA